MAYSRMGWRGWMMYVVVGFVAIGSGTTIVHTITPRFALVRVANAIPTTASGSIGINKNYREEHCHCEEQQHFTNLKKRLEFLNNVQISIEHSLKPQFNTASDQSAIQQFNSQQQSNTNSRSTLRRVRRVSMSRIIKGSQTNRRTVLPATA